MKILVTGASGFVGRHLVTELLQRGHDVSVAGRSLQRMQELPWHERVAFVELDLATGYFAGAGQSWDAVAHLAWPGLPNYKDWFHLTDNVPQSLRWLHSLVLAGCPKVVVAGTCLEYGLREGLLRESDPPNPSVAYSVAKDTLRVALTVLSRELSFRLVWARLFYLHGPGQSPRTLLGQLSAAIDAGRSHFEMSPGDQGRDYLEIRQAANHFADLLVSTEAEGIYNICSGQPTTVYDLAADYRSQRGSMIELVRGAFPYSDYEPHCFYGDVGRLAQLRKGQAIPKGGQ